MSRHICFINGKSLLEGGFGFVPEISARHSGHDLSREQNVCWDAIRVLLHKLVKRVDSLTIFFFTLFLAAGFSPCGIPSLVHVILKFPIPFQQFWIDGQFHAEVCPLFSCYFPADLS